MPRSAYTTVVDIAAEQQGYVTQQDARGAGIAATTLARMAERGTLVRTSHGVYRVPLIPAGRWISTGRRRCGRAARAACSATKPR